MQKHGVPTSPRRSGLSWREFVGAPASALVATDYFMVDTWNLRQVYVLFFMELSTQRVVSFGVTENPNQKWVRTEARNLTWRLPE
jgi:putative transposase